jgi:hypothetical protein
MENIDKFTTITFIKHKDIILLEFIVNHSVPTSLQWLVSVNELKNALEELKTTGTKFGFLFDVQKLGFISLSYMKEFTEIMSSHGPLLETKLYATAAIAKGSLIKYLFDAINMLYKTKKPLKLVDNRADALTFIDANIF